MGTPVIERQRHAVPARPERAPLRGEPEEFFLLAQKAAKLNPRDAVRLIALSIARESVR